MPPFRSVPRRCRDEWADGFDDAHPGTDQVDTGQFGSRLQQVAEEESRNGGEDDPGQGPRTQGWARRDVAKRHQPACEETETGDERGQQREESDAGVAQVEAEVDGAVDFETDEGEDGQDQADDADCQ